ncbi:RDD family protein [Mycobacterium sp. MS1601]|uniref:RDD family protein n=1 Tax=Mycobacterium sp. MS1601 TaxID=1936029 RepID=UPI0009F86BEC
MTSGEYPNNPDPNYPPQPGAYPPPPPPQYGPPPGGAYPPPPQGNYPPPPQGNYPPPPPPQYGVPGGYPPPQFGPVGGVEPGGLGLRFAARLIDGVLVGIVVSILLLATGLWDGYLVPGIFSGVLVFAYFVGFEVTQGWTPAKKMLGLSVRGPGGAPKPDFKQSAIRNSFTLLSIIPFIGGLLAFIAYIVIAVTINNSPIKQGKHDELAGGTQVVKG